MKLNTKIPAYKIQGFTIMAIGVFLLLVSLSASPILEAEENERDRDCTPIDRNNISERPDGESTDRERPVRERPERDSDSTDRDDVDRERPARERPDQEPQGEEREGIPTDSDNVPERPAGEPTDRERPERELLNQERIDAYIARLREAAANGDKEAAMKLRQILARLDGASDQDQERPERERPERERPNQERIDAYIARLRAAAANGDEEAAMKLRQILARLDAIKDGERERPEREDVPERERPNQERIDAIISRLRRAAANGDEEAAMKLRHLLARLDCIEERRPDRDDVPDRD